MNPLPALNTLAGAFRDWVRKAPWLLAHGLPGILCTLLVAFAASRALPVLADRTLALGSLARIAALGVALIVTATLLFCALSWVWRAADRVFYSSQQWIGNPMTCLSATFVVAFPLIGLAFLGWLLLIAIAPRLGGPEGFELELLWPLGEASREYLLVAGGWLAVCSPLLLRLYYAPAIAALEDGEAKSAFQTMMRTTKGKTLPLMLATLPHLALCVLAVVLAGRAFAAGGPVAALVPLLVCIVVISLWSTLQVAVLRHFVGMAVPGTTDVELDFKVETPASPDDRPADAPQTAIVEGEDPAQAGLPTLPEALKPKEAAEEKAQQDAPAIPDSPLVEAPDSPLDEGDGADPAATAPEQAGDEARSAAERFFADVAADEEPEGAQEGAQPSAERDAQPAPAAEQAASASAVDRFFADVDDGEGQNGDRAESEAQDGADPRPQAEAQPEQRTAAADEGEKAAALSQLLRPPRVVEEKTPPPPPGLAPVDTGSEPPPAGLTPVGAQDDAPEGDGAGPVQIPPSPEIPPAPAVPPPVATPEEPPVPSAAAAGPAAAGRRPAPPEPVEDGAPEPAPEGAQAAGEEREAPRNPFRDS